MRGCVLLAGLLLMGNPGPISTLHGLLLNKGDGQYPLTTINVESDVIGQQKLEKIANSLTDLISRKEPTYATWGALAIEQTKRKYKADVIDYLYMGRTTLSSTLAEEKFKLWLKKGTQEFGVYATVAYHPLNKQFLSIRFEEF